MAFIQIEHPDIEAGPDGPAEVHHTALSAYAERGWRPVKDAAPRYQDRDDHDAVAEAVAAVSDTGGAPSKSASKAAWVAYAVAHGADPEAAEATTKPDLIADFGDTEGSN